MTRFNLLVDGEADKDRMLTTQQIAQEIAKGEAGFDLFAKTFKDRLAGVFPTAQFTHVGTNGWRFILDGCDVFLNPTLTTNPIPLPRSGFNVLLHSSLSIRQRGSSNGYEGRGYSLWYGDFLIQDEPQWYEAAFSVRNGLVPTVPYSDPSYYPISLTPNEADDVVNHSTDIYLLTREFIPLDSSESFLAKWVDMIEQAKEDTLAPEISSLTHEQIYASFRDPTPPPPFTDVFNRRQRNSW